MSKYCIPHMTESENPHILNICPPLSFKKEFVILSYIIVWATCCLYNG